MVKAGRGSDQFMVRLPDGMRDHLKEAADKNARSMNSEIVQRLESSFELGELQGALEHQAILNRRSLNEEIVSRLRLSLEKEQKEFDEAHDPTTRVQKAVEGLDVNQLAEEILGLRKELETYVRETEKDIERIVKDAIRDANG